MTSVQRFIANDRNAVAGAVLTASVVKAARAVRQVSTTRAGNGRAVLAGDYVGHADTDIELEVIAGGTTQRASAPSFAGVGSGALSVVAVDSGATAQTLTFTLADLGTETTHAELAVSGISIRAQASGAAGNAIRISVVPDLTATATAYSLLADWPARQTTQTGEQWAMGGLPLSSKGELDALSPRIRFGDDLDVYRPYREYKDGAWRMGLSPALKTDLKAGTPIYAITGGYDITVTDGVTPEVYEDVESFHDLIVALAASSLVEVVGVAAADRRPGGIAVVDVPLRTTAWVLSQTGKITLADVSAAADAPTEIVTIKCSNADAIGGEVWTVSGTVSGNIGQAITGIPFTASPLAFTVPAPALTSLGSGTFSSKFVPTSRTDTDPGIPSVCVRNFRLGANATPKTITFTYEERPDNDTCDCNTVALSGRITDACLGLQGSPEDAAMAIDTEYLNRIKLLYQWREDSVRANTDYGASTTIPAVPASYRVVVNIWDDVYQQNNDQPQFELVSVNSWATLEDLESVVASFTDGPVPGTLPHSLPHIGISISLEGVAFTLAATHLSPDEELTYLDEWLHPLSIQVAWQATAASPATTLPAYFDAAEVDITLLDNAIGILSGCLAEIYLSADARTDWDTLLAEVQADFSLIDDNPFNDVQDTGKAGAINYMERYRATCDNIRLTAGVLPKGSASGSIAGDGCWRDDESATHWWVDSDGIYLPIFTNQAYVSVVPSSGTGASADVPAGAPFSTKEFGLYIAASCEERLKEGDQVVIKILGVDGDRPYSVGDDAVIAVVGGGPAYLSGGVTGDDTLTFAVSGSVDGPLDPYALTALEPSYIDAGIEVQINRGGIPFALGDTFTLGIETGQFRWRRDGGAWSTAADIEDGALALADGLTVEFVPGAAPSFLDGDAWIFSARQPYAPANLQTPDAAVWAWSGTGANIIINLGAETDISALALARYSLPTGATVLIEGGDGSTWPKSQSMDVSGAVSVAMLADIWSVTHLRLTVASATGGSIGWLWAGLPLATTYSAARCRMARSYAIQRGGSINPSSQFLGAGQAGEIAWDADSSPLLQSDLDAVLAMLDHMQRQAEPMILVPHFLHASESGLVRVETDSIDPQEYFQLQPDNSAHRIISLDLELRAVHQ